MIQLTASRFVRDLTTDYPDFPSPGILFRDLTPVFADAQAFRAVVDALVDGLDGADGPGAAPVAIAGVEARGFLLAAAGAYCSGLGVLAVRKAGKLPGTVLSESYELEYGSAALELHADRLPAGSPVLLVDDLLATGGTLAAAALLLERAGYVVAGIRVVVELDGLGGRERLAGYEVSSIVRY